MTSQERQAETIKVLVLCVLSLWSFVPAEPIGLSQAASGTDEPPTFVAWPEKGLGLSIDLAGFKKDIDQVKPDGRRYLTALHHKTGLTVSVSLEKVPTHATAHRMHRTAPTDTERFVCHPWAGHRTQYHRCDTDP